MVVAFGVHGASKEKWKTENEEKITIFFNKKDFFFWNDLIETTQFLNKLKWHLDGGPFCV